MQNGVTNLTLIFLASFASPMFASVIIMQTKYFTVLT